MRAWLISLIALSCVSSGLANSPGSPHYPTAPNAPACSVNANFGCSSFAVVNGVEDRINGCLDKDPTTGAFIPLMYWAKKAVRSDAYAITVLDNAKTYTPGSLVQLRLSVLDVNFAYTGLMLYAVDSNEKKVGAWTITNRHYHLPWENKTPANPCAGTLMHNSAETKPLYNTFYFTAPPAGTGKITFRCLIKQGIANTGAFYYPMGVDLSLNEAPVVQTTAQRTLTTAVGQSCQEFCTKNFLSNCDATAVANLAMNFQTVSQTQVCALPLLSNCAAPGASTGAENLCYNDCAPAATKDYCNIKSSLPEDGNRFCVCTKSGGGGTPPTTSGTAGGGGSSSADPTSGSGSDSGSKPSGGSDGTNTTDGGSDINANGGTDASASGVGNVDHGVAGIAGGVGGGIVVIGVAIGIGYTVKKKNKRKSVAYPKPGLVTYNPTPVSL